MYACSRVGALESPPTRVARVVEEGGGRGSTKDGGSIKTYSLRSRRQSTATTPYSGEAHSHLRTKFTVHTEHDYRTWNM